jgi:hypothetical protein
MRDTAGADVTRAGVRRIEWFKAGSALNLIKEQAARATV